jgi:hypothetical protein
MPAQGRPPTILRDDCHSSFGMIDAAEETVNTGTGGIRGRLKTNDPWTQRYQALRSQYLDSLCILPLRPGDSSGGKAYARVSAASGNVRVFFEHERGL